MEDKIKLQDYEREMRRFLERDPIPQLSEAEVTAMTARVLAGERIERPTLWYQIGPFYKGALGIAAVLVFAFVSILISISDDKIEVVDSKYSDEAFENNSAEEVLVEAIVSGDVELGLVYRNLIDVSSEELSGVLSEVVSEDIYSNIDELSEEEAVKILQVMDELGYPDRET